MLMTTNANQRLLVVEDDASMRDFLQSFLGGYGYRLSEATTGQLALELAAKDPPDLILLDLRLPGMDGEDVLKKLREWYRGPIIVLSCLYQDELKIFALDNGANDYLTKPFSSGELLARIRVALRNTNGQSTTSEPVFQSGDLRVDLTARLVHARGSEVRLTRTEYKILTILVQHAGKVLTHKHLSKEIWNEAKTESYQRLRVNMRNLRRKIEARPHRPKHLLTELGVGYRLAFNQNFADPPSSFIPSRPVAEA